MKLVFVTQVLDADDAVLGFVCRWVAGFAKHCDEVRVLALEVGRTDGLPANVSHRVVGRKGVIGRYLRYRGLVQEAFTDGFDTVLTHMVPRYSVVADGWCRKAGAGHFLWYTHKGVDDRLRKAVAKVDKVFTASDESMRIDTPKKVVTGHGIDVEHFHLGDAPEVPTRLLSVGRLTPAKDPLTILEALAQLRADGRDVCLDWAGGGLASGDVAFADAVKGKIQSLGLEDHVHLHGDVPYVEIGDYYRRATVLVSSSKTGSVDKVVLEAMACGRPVVTCNESFPPIFAELGDVASEMEFEQGDAALLTNRLRGWLDRSQAERDEVGKRLRGLVERDHEVDTLMARLVRDMESA